MPGSPPNPRVLDALMRVYRIGDSRGRYPTYSGEGAAMVEGRWHRRGQEVIYASEHYSTSMLEKLVHLNGEFPPNQHYIEIDIPAGVSYEIVTKDSLPGWIDKTVARAFGSKWIEEVRSAILIVPSIVARMENNVLIHPRHDDFRRITKSLENPIVWDRRLLEN